MTKPQLFRYLRITGAFPWWQTAVLSLIAAFGVAEFALAGRGETGCILFMVLFPVFVGTALLDSARQGHLDLLVGAGESRSRLYWGSAARALTTPLVLGVIVLALSSQEWTFAGVTSRVVKGVAVIAFTGGVCFAAGIVQPAFLAGCAWAFLRLFGLLLPPFTRFLSEFTVWTNGGAAPAVARTALAFLVVPELAIERNVHITFSLIMAVVGVGSVALAARRFSAADFAGRRRP
ncbi:MAG TPA: hypothetical protein VNC59_02870 [Thermoanaerobaculia bacterium]|nr:hypothetical protein [Thermoanaerobaculia bacterium]